MNINIGDLIKKDVRPDVAYVINIIDNNRVHLKWTSDNYETSYSLTTIEGVINNCYWKHIKIIKL